MKKRHIPTIQQLALVIRHIDLSRLENRHAGQSLVELEHCLLEVLDYLHTEHDRFLSDVNQLEELYKESQDKTTFARHLKLAVAAFGDVYAPAALIGEYFNDLKWRLLAEKEDQLREFKDLDDNGSVPITRAFVLARLICKQIDFMWAHEKEVARQADDLRGHTLN